MKSLARYASLAAWLACLMVNVDGQGKDKDSFITGETGKYRVFLDKQEDWYESLKFCKSHFNAQLGILATKKDWDVLTKYLSDQFRATKHYQAWLGYFNNVYSDEKGEKFFRTLYGGPVPNIGKEEQPNMWGPGEPKVDKVKGLEDQHNCVVIKFDDGWAVDSAKLYAIPCKEKRYYICHKCDFNKK